MRAVEAGSWVLRFDVPMEPHVALFVRDSLSLDTSSSALKLPPELEGDIPDYSSLVSEEDCERWEESFASWWQLAFAGAGLTENGDAEDPAALPRRLERFSEEFYAPLAPYPELRHAASTWFYGHSEPHRRHDPKAAQTYWAIARDAAEAAATELGVSPGEVHANTWLLLVQDVWYAAPEPGRLLYSPTVREDTKLLSELLFDTFTSSVRG